MFDHFIHSVLALLEVLELWRRKYEWEVGERGLGARRLGSRHHIEKREHAETEHERF
jgi:hypothetical protein